VDERYLLPCPCGRHVPVTRRQAGQTVRCACGESLEVPTLLRLTSLPTAAEPAPAAPSGATWGLRHRLWLLGTVIFVLAVVPIVVLVLCFPSPPQKVIPPPEQIREESQAFSATDAWVVWRRLERSDVNALFVRDQLGFKEAVLTYDELSFKYQLSIAVLALFCGLGVALVIVGSLKKPAGP